MDKRKTAQDGINKFWRLYANDEDPLICPIRALMNLHELYAGTVAPAGLLFRQLSLRPHFCHCSIRLPLSVVLLSSILPRLLVLRTPVVGM